MFICCLFWCSALYLYFIWCYVVVSCLVLLFCKTETRSCGQARSTAGSSALFCSVQTSSMFCTEHQNSTLHKNIAAHCTEPNSTQQGPNQRNIWLKIDILMKNHADKKKYNTAKKPLELLPTILAHSPRVHNRFWGDF